MGHNLVKGHGDRCPPGIGDDAVGAELVAPVLDFQICPGHFTRYGPVGLCKCLKLCPLAVFRFSEIKEIVCRLFLPKICGDHRFILVADNKIHP